MNIILCHIGNTLPSYIFDNLKQLQIFNGESIIYLILNKKAYISRLDDFKKVKLKYIEDYANQYNFINNDFWGVTTKRLFYIEELMRKDKLKNIIHIENDVLLYSNFNNLDFNNYKIGITLCGPQHASCAIMFIKDDYHLSLLNDKIKKRIKIKKISGSYSEMIIIRHIFDGDNEDKLLQRLPILPDHPTESYNLTQFNSLFDPASWGQYIGGAPKVPNSWVGDHHYIGYNLKRNIINMKFINKNGKKVPIALYNNLEYPINNLHIHSKHLNKFLSL